MIGTHNSLTYLNPKYWIFKLFTFLWRTQTKNLHIQKREGVTYFDIRVRRDKYSWRLCHGLVDLEKSYSNLADLVELFTGMHIRLILERGSNLDKEIFVENLKYLITKYPQIVFSCIKKNWVILYNKDFEIKDYTYIPWYTGLSVKENLKMHNFFSTIKRWAKKHNPVITKKLIESPIVHFIDRL